MISQVKYSVLTAVSPGECNYSGFILNIGIASKTAQVILKYNRGCEPPRLVEADVSQV